MRILLFIFAYVNCVCFELNMAAHNYWVIPLNVMAAFICLVSAGYIKPLSK